MGLMGSYSEICRDGYIWAQLLKLANGRSTSHLARGDEDTSLLEKRALIKKRLTLLY
jgi:hypothetical protein